jgi:hypothetical protein
MDPSLLLIHGAGCAIGPMPTLLPQQQLQLHLISIARGGGSFAPLPLQRLARFHRQRAHSIYLSAVVF